MDIFIKKHRIVLIICAVFLLNLALRLLPYKGVFTGSGIILVDGDSYYHLRRILLIAQNFPHIPAFDYYINFPEGAKPPWPPLYDFFVASIAFIAGFGNPSVRLIESTAALIAPFIGALTVIPLFFLARRLFNDKIALWGCFFFSLIPGHILYSSIGRPDHHAIESFMATLFTLFYVASFQDYEKKKHLYAFPIFAGIFLSASIFIWTGAIIYLAFAVFASVALILRNQFILTSSKPVFFTITVISFTSFIGIVLYLLITSTWKPFSYIALSGFHALILLFIGLFFLAIWFVSEWIIKKKLKGIYLFLAGLFLFIFFITVFIAFCPEFLTQFYDGVFKQIGKSVLWRKIVSESRPLFAETTLKGYMFSLENGKNIASLAVFLIPFAFIALFLEREKKNEKIFFMLWSIPFLMLTLNQMRYIYYFAVHIGIITAYIMLRVMNLHKSGEFTMIIMFAFMTLFNPTLDKIIDSVKIKQMINRLGDDGVKTLLWLRDKTPDDGDFFKPANRPYYGVMCTWAYGHELSYISRRPVIANNFGDILGSNGFLNVLKYFTTGSVEESYSILEKHNTKYILVTNPDLHSAYSYRMLGNEKSTYFTDDWKPTEKAQKEIVIHRLYFNEGNGIGRYRLIYESSQDQTYISHNYQKFKKYKVFEFVKGAVVKGTANPGENVLAVLKVISNQGRDFTYTNSALTNKNGIFKIILPYSTASLQNGFYTDKSYKLFFINRKIKLITVTEDDVLHGKEVYVK